MVVRVFLISNYQLVCLGLKSLFETEPGRFELVCSSDSLAQPTIEAIVAASPDVVLLDIDTDPNEVVPLISSLHTKTPNTKILLLSRFDNSDLQDQAITSGAHGIIDKETPPNVLLTAITKVSKGQIWLDRAATGRLFVELSRKVRQPAANTEEATVKLTEREKQIIACVTSSSNGSGKAIAARLGISESTLRNHLSAIYEKIGVSNRYELLAYAYQNGLSK